MAFILTCIAVLCFLLAGVRARSGRINWIGLGLFFWALAGLIGE
jgi:hypothetical protein